ncbi:hypothetical protein ACEWY4_022907 [Coilia grayii]|uniref:DUF4806 domain-containing protein n=1 Tax=Coilia grayii TaxID=363190 RepID=A0ABD1J2G2_9TELE
METSLESEDDVEDKRGSKLTAPTNKPDAGQGGNVIRRKPEKLEVLLRKVMEIQEEMQNQHICQRTCPERTGVARLELGVEVAKTQAELEDLEQRLKDTEFRKKIVSHLSLKSGTSDGDCIRRMMRAIATNHVWSAYSLRGKKGKRALFGTVLCTTIIQAVLKWKPGLGEKAVEGLIAETLKHAPSAHLKAQAKCRRQLGEDQQQAAVE